MPSRASATRRCRPSSLAATALLEAQGLKVKCETENVKLPHDRETALALSLREAATNIRRHARRHAA